MARRYRRDGGIKAPSCCSERSSAQIVSRAMLRVATSSDGIPKREGFWSSRPLCRFVMNSMATVLFPSSHTEVVPCPRKT